MDVRLFQKNKEKENDKNLSGQKDKLQAVKGRWKSWGIQPIGRISIKKSLKMTKDRDN